MNNAVTDCFGRAIVFLFSFFALSFLTGCGFLNRQFPNLGLPEPKLTATEMSVATGSAIGAGVGAVIGSTTGAIGEGLAIGAVGGAAVGAIVGKQIDGGESAIEEQKSAVAKADEQIELQQKEINDLRMKSGDNFEGVVNERDITTPPISGAPSRFNFQSLPVYEPGPNVRSFNGTFAAIRRARYQPDVSPANISQANLLQASEVKRTFSAPRVATFESISSKTEIAKTGISHVNENLVRNEKVFKSELSSAKESVEAVAKEEAVKQKQVLSEIKQPEFEKHEIAKSQIEDRVNKEVIEIKKIEKTVVPNQTKEIQTVGKLTTSTSTESDKDDTCVTAKEEARRAEKSSSSADKLFYYRRAIRLCPTEAAYHIGAGGVYAALGRNEDARFEFTKALDVDPNNEQAHEQLQLLSSVE